jgi:hypothetical protein
MMTVSAVAVTSASAASYSAAGVAAGAKVKINNGVTTVSNTVLSATGQPTIECSKVEAVGGEFENGTNKGAVTSLRFFGCIDVSSSKCLVSTIETKPGNIILTGTATAHVTQEVFTPKTGEEFTSFKLKNKGEESCGTTGSLVVKGPESSRPENNSNQATTHNLGFNGTGLTYAGKPAHFSGVGTISIEGGKAFSLLF